jgi:hypothetical protein
MRIEEKKIKNHYYEDNMITSLIVVFVSMTVSRIIIVWENEYKKVINYGEINISH